MSKNKSKENKSVSHVEGRETQIIDALMEEFKLATYVQRMLVDAVRELTVAIKEQKRVSLMNPRKHNSSDLLSKYRK